MIFTESYIVSGVTVPAMGQTKKIAAVDEEAKWLSM
jgi:hypothetical protein